MTVIGLTGSSGSGKSTVASLLSDRQFHIIDCDTVARTVLRPDTTCLSDIFHTFGQNVKNEDGSLNRAALADIVFRDKKKLEQLNGIMYPQITADIKKQLEELSQQGNRFVVLDAPTLFESGADQLCDITVSVLSEDVLRLQRIMKRDNISIEQAKNRLSSQYPNSFYRERSDYTVENSGSIEYLKKQIDQLIDQIQAKNV